MTLSQSIQISLCFSITVVYDAKVGKKNEKNFDPSHNSRSSSLPAEGGGQTEGDRVDIGRSLQAEGLVLGESLDAE